MMVKTVLRELNKLIGRAPSDRACAKIWIDVHGFAKVLDKEVQRQRIAASKTATEAKRIMRIFAEIEAIAKERGERG